MQQPHAGQVAHGALDAIALGEILRSPGDLLHQLREDQVGRVQRENLGQDDALVTSVLGGGGRGVLVARPFRVVLHRKGLLSVPRPRLFLQRGGTSLSDGERTAASAKTQVLRQVDRDACV